MLIHNPIFTGSISLNGADISQISTVSSDSSSFATRITSTESTASAFILASGSFSTRTTANEATASALVTASGSLSTRVTAAEATASAFVTASGSLSARITSNEARTGSFATTGSNYFIGTQVITGSVYISSDLIVQGSSSLQNITASAVSIGTNTVILNTDSPAVRFAGISVRDSGSNSSVTSSIWYDSLNNKWIYQNESGSSYSGGMFISGPRNTGSLGDEAGMDSGYITKGLGGDHIGPSIIFESGSRFIGIGNTTPANVLHLIGNVATPALRLGSTSLTYFWDIGRENATTGDFVFNNAEGGSISERARITVNGNIGVGTDSPTNYSGYTTLHINGKSGTGSGVLRVTNFNGTAGFNMYADNAATFNTTNAIPILFLTQDTERMRINISGSVGIGITNPTYTLDVNAPNNVRFFGNSYTSLTIATTSGTNFSLTNRYTDNRFSIDATGFGEIMNFMSTGRVGIGSVSPNNLLSVRGNLDLGATGYSYAGPAQYGGIIFPRGQILFSNSNSQNQLYLSSNAYTNADGIFAYRTSSQPATFIGQDNGAVVIGVAGNGTANAVISWTNALSITNSGNTISANFAFADAFGATGNNTMSSWGATPVRPIIEGREGNAISNYIGLPESYYSSNAYYSGTAWIRKSANASINMVISGYNNNFLVQSGATGAAGGIISFNTLFYINGANGNIGIGTTSPGAKLHIEAASVSYGQFRITSTSNSSGEASINFGRTDQTLEQRWTVGQGLNGAGNAFAFYTGGTNRMILNTDGSIFVGGTSIVNSPRFSVIGSGVWDGAAIGLSNTGTGGEVYTIFSTNNAFAQGGSSLLFYNATQGRNNLILYSNGNYDFMGSDVSDARLKQDIEDLNYGLDEIMELSPKSYHLKSKNNLDGNDQTTLRKRYGFIAQEIQPVLPDAITGEETETDYLGLDYNGVLAVAVKAIQELSAKVAALEAQQ